MSQIHIWETTGILRWFKARKLAKLLAEHKLKENLHIVLPFSGVSVTTLNIDSTVEQNHIVTTN